MSEDRGATWSSDQRLTTGNPLSTLAAIDVDRDGDVYLMWTEHVGRGRTQVMFIRGARK